ncbi:DNA replication endonuclease-helicase Dna2, partial [Cryomyces antarcticus]
LVDERGWRVDLPAGATEGHVWDAAGTQAEGTQISPLKGRRSPVKGGGSPKKKSTPNNRNSPTKKSSPLSPVRADKVKKSTGTKIAGKSGSVGKRMLLGRRGVLRDIVNEALGEEFVD